MTHYFAEVNAIHPFREGNRRAKRGVLPPAQLRRPPQPLAVLAGHEPVAVNLGTSRDDSRLDALLDGAIR